MSEFLAPLGDAAIALALLVMLIAGTPVEWVVGIFLGLEIFSSLCKSFVAFLTPLISAARSRHGI